jgi:hypothetical protein
MKPPCLKSEERFLTARADHLQEQTAIRSVGPLRSE